MISIIIICILVLGVLLLQREHHRFLTRESKEHDIATLFQMLEEVDKKFKEFDDYKKKVDVLTLRAGFKL